MNLINRIKKLENKKLKNKFIILTLMNGENPNIEIEKAIMKRGGIREDYYIVCLNMSPKKNNQES